MPDEPTGAPASAPAEEKAQAPKAPEEPRADAATAAEDPKAKPVKSPQQPKAPPRDAGGVPAPEASAITLAGHPRAARVVRRSREAAGLFGFLVGGWMSISTHTIADTLLRAVIAGVACQVIVWAAAVVLCRYLISAELRSREYALMQAAIARRQASERGLPLPAAAAAPERSAS